MMCTFFVLKPAAETSWPVAGPEKALPPSGPIVNFAEQVIFWSDLSSSLSSDDADDELEMLIKQPNYPIEHE